MSNTAKLIHAKTRFLEIIHGKEEDYTVIPIKRGILLLSIPMVLEMFMESTFALVDALFVSRLDVKALATVGLTESVVILVYAIAFGLSMSTTALVARRVGEKDYKNANTAATQSIILGIALSIIISIFGIIFAKDILYFMKASPDVVEYGYKYTQIVFGGNIAILLLFLNNAIFRGAGDASVAMKSLILANGINIILDPCLIFGLAFFPNLGLEGAAIATLIGRLIGVIYQFIHLFNGKHIVKLAWEDFTIKVHEIINLVKISLGGIGQFVISTVSWTILVRIIAEFGSVAVASYTIAFRVVIFTVLPSWGMSNAAATLVGQNLGAKKPERAIEAVKITARYNVIFLTFLSIILISCDTFILKLFVDDPATIESGALSLRYFCYSYIFFGYGMVLTQAFNGAGDTMTPTKINVVSHLLFQIPAAYFFAHYLAFGFKGVYVALILSECLLVIISHYLFKKGNWLKVQV
jgi:putative MATE family efflux protein